MVPKTVLVITQQLMRHLFQPLCVSAVVLNDTVILEVRNSNLVVLD